jgi:hypothetical protein
MNANVGLVGNREPVAVGITAIWMWNEKMVKFVYKDLGADINQIIDSPDEQNALQWTIEMGMAYLFGK